MEKLFGLEMETIAAVLSAGLALVLLGLALLALRRPVFFKLGLRPIPRRKAQSVLIVTGLMLATLIITAAFVTGDTLSHSIRTVAIEGMGEIDEVIQAAGGQEAGARYFSFARYEALAEELAGYPLVDRFVPAVGESAPVVNITRRRSLGRVNIMGLRAEDAWLLPGKELADADGQALALADLGANEVYLNAAAAESLSAAPGDALEVYAGSHPRLVTVRAVAAQGQEPRMLMTLRQAQVMFNQRGKINMIFVSNQGDALGGAAHSQGC